MSGFTLHTQNFIGKGKSKRRRRIINSRFSNLNNFISLKLNLHLPLQYLQYLDECGYQRYSNQRITLKKIKERQVTRKLFVVLCAELFALGISGMYAHAEESENLRRVRYKGSNWSITLPENYQRIHGKNCKSNCQNPSSMQLNNSLDVIQFKDSQGAEVSIYVREANTFKLSLFQLSNIEAFGDPQNAALLLLPTGHELLNSNQRLEHSSNDERLYYTWDFIYSDQRVLVTATLYLGKVFFLGTSAPILEWAAREPEFQNISSSFNVGISY